MTDKFIAERLMPAFANAYANTDTDLYDCCRRTAAEIGAYVSSGATRVCLIFPNDNEVIKFTETSYTDYSKIEYENYKLACDYGIEKILLPTRPYPYIDTYSNISIYIQTKYSFSWEEALPTWRSNLSTSSMIKNVLCSKIFNKFYNRINGCRLSKLWFAYVYALYGKKFCNQFIKWILKTNVNDLHSGNIGFYKRKPIILDYAGYYEKHDTTT